MHLPLLRSIIVPPTFRSFHREALKQYLCLFLFQGINSQKYKPPKNLSQSAILYRLVYLLFATQLYKMQTNLLTVSLNFHSADFVYSFLQKKVGPLYMTVKGRRAIVNFPKPEHAVLALRNFNNFNLNTMPLMIKPFAEGDLEDTTTVAPALDSIEPRFMVDKQVQMEEEAQAKQPSPQLSEFTLQIQESLKMVDPQNMFEAITKKTRRDIMQYVNSYTLLLQAAQSKKAEIVQTVADPPEQSRKIVELQSYYKEGLNRIMTAIQKEFKNLRKCVAKYGKQENIEVEPEITIKQMPQKKNNEFAAFKNSLQYNVAEGFEVKRIAALNEKQFVTTTSKKPMGNLAFYRLDYEDPQTVCEIKQGAYGLLTVENYILVGTMQGSIAFFNINDLSTQELSLKLHNGAIYELVYLCRMSDTHNLVSLSSDQSLKIVRVQQQSYSETSKTLFFECSNPIGGNSSIINSVVALQQSKIAYSRQKSIYLYDCQSKGTIQEKNTRGMALKLAKINEMIVAAANEKYLSFVDFRDNAKIVNFDVAKEVKTLASLSQHTVFYGCMDGEVGVIDRRMNAKDHWRTGAIHKGRIYDVCTIGDMVITGDNRGQLASWLPNQSFSRNGNGIVANYK